MRLSKQMSPWPVLIKEAHNSRRGAGKQQEEEGQGVSPFSVVVFSQITASHASTTKLTVLFKNVSGVIWKTFVIEFNCSRSKFSKPSNPIPFGFLMYLILAVN